MLFKKKEIYFLLCLVDAEKKVSPSQAVGNWFIILTPKPTLDPEPTHRPCPMFRLSSTPAATRLSNSSDPISKIRLILYVSAHFIHILSLVSLYYAQTD